MSPPRLPLRGRASVAPASRRPYTRPAPSRQCPQSDTPRPRAIKRLPDRGRRPWPVLADTASRGPRRAPARAAGAGVAPPPPRQPGGAGEKAGASAAARVELADEIDEVGGGGVEVGGELGDLVAEPIERAGRVGRHRESSLC